MGFIQWNINEYLLTVSGCSSNYVNAMILQGEIENKYQLHFYIFALGKN